MTPERREMALYEKAVAKWGKRAQALKAIEEMSELSQAILKLVFCEDYGIGGVQETGQPGKPSGGISLC